MSGNRTLSDIAGVYETDLRPLAFPKRPLVAACCMPMTRMVATMTYGEFAQPLDSHRQTIPLTI
jgi:hypothetical protein